MSLADALPKHLMMRGTDGYLDYLIVGRRGKIGLGIKPNAIAPGRLPGTTFIGVRVRSAELPPDTISEMEGTVASFADAKMTHPEAWPKMNWDKVDSKRASAQLGITVLGTPKMDVENLLPQFTDIPDSAVRKLATFVKSVVDEDHMVLTEDEIVGWLVAFYETVTAGMKQQVDQAKALDDALKSTIGTVTMQADLIKKMQASVGSTGMAPNHIGEKVSKTAKPVEDIPDIEDVEYGEDED